MVREIHLATGLYDNKILTLADNENLEFKLIGRTYPNLTYYLRAIIGGKCYNLKFNDNLCVFERKNLVYGKFKAKVVAMANENIVREFEIEDLLLKEIDTELKTIPEFEIVKSELEVVKSENEAMKVKIAELEKLCNDTLAMVIEINGITQKVGE